MILLFGMQLLPLAFGALYISHSVRNGRRAQAAAIAALLLVLTAVLGTLLWEFCTMP